VEKMRIRPFMGLVSLEKEMARTLRFELFEKAQGKIEAAKRDWQRNWRLYLVLCLLIFLVAPSVGYCDVEGTMRAFQGKLVGTILPLAAILGFVFAGFSFVAGSPNARTHLVLAIIGAVVGFGAQSIMEFIKSLVQ
jgi:type IV secretory pathway VirB2 component (pilin)